MLQWPAYLLDIACFAARMRIEVIGFKMHRFAIVDADYLYMRALP